LDGKKEFGGIDVFRGKKRLCPHLTIASSIYIYIYIYIYDLIIIKLFEKSIRGQNLKLNTYIIRKIEKCKTIYYTIAIESVQLARFNMLRFDLIMYFFLHRMEIKKKYNKEKKTENRIKSPP
jgi:hypothetical protein